MFTKTNQGAELSPTHRAEVRRRYKDNILEAITGRCGVSQREARRMPTVEWLQETYVPDAIWEKVAVLDYYLRDGIEVRDRVDWLKDALRGDLPVPPALAVELYPAARLSTTG